MDQMLPNTDTLASLRARVAELEAQVMQRWVCRITKPAAGT